MRRLKRVALVGTGLIGGSLAMALRRAGLVDAIAGADSDAAALARALELGVIDAASASIAEAARGAELVVVAVPVRSIGAVLEQVREVLDPAAAVTDVGSTKAEVVRAARASLGAAFPRFVPGHPIAGRESSGVAAATADLFAAARVVLTPVAETAPDAVDRVGACWEAAGGRVTRLSPEAHDRIFAAVSHLPHVLSFALVAEIAARGDGAELFGFAGGGFRDFTRIAASSPQMWRDIALHNREALLVEMDRYGERLAMFRDLVDRGDAAGLERVFDEARASRQALGPKRRPGPE